MMENSEPRSKKKMKNKKKINTEPMPEQVQAKAEVTGIQVYHNKNMHKRTELVVCPSGCSVEFVGTSYAGEAWAAHRSMYALAVFDKEAQTLKVMHIGANKIFRLEPKVKGLEYNMPPPTLIVEEMSPDQ
ncbi:hypothetical protein TSUD_386150 [Trifolium subterraneum]|uniref:Uncharacterized protein n=1 Tax=Trifolium subterraneum TaxID=3900 RepID=A0A2Z6LX11_TRISU|nr:hypothetical protein TSUD_386150 [Trifolium subterraneum]